MPQCSIIECNARKSKNQPNLTLHRMPKNTIIRKKWLNAIGVTNINPRHKNLYVCSLHFEDSNFNRTLDVLRLHDNAIPSLGHMQSASKEIDPLLIQNEQNISASNSVTSSPEHSSTTVQSPNQGTCHTLSSHLRNRNVKCTKEHNTVPSTLKLNTATFPIVVTSSPVLEKQLDPLLINSNDTLSTHTSTKDCNTLDPVPVLAENIRNLKEKCEHQRKKIKCLHEIIRRQKNKIALFSNVIKDLRKREIVYVVVKE